MDIHELRRRGIQEIFNFYSRQHIPQGRKFEELEEAMSQIDLGEFMKFCKDFDIPLPKAKIQEVFKKSCVMGHKPLKLEQFDASLTRLGIEINRLRVMELEQKLKMIDKQIRMNINGGRGGQYGGGQMEYEEGMDEEQQPNEDELMGQQEEMMQHKEELENKGEEECREDILNIMECHDQNKYRKKIKGYHIAFNIREK